MSIAIRECYPLRARLQKGRISAIALIVIIFLITGCGTGPTKRSVDGDWSVSENVCSTDPDQPDKGDIRSEIRTRSNGTNAQRVVFFYYLDKTILELKNNFTSPTASTGELTVYENTPDNEVKRTQKARNLKENNQGIKEAVVEFFENDPNVDGSKAISFCLYRGQ